jgi:hypothetical protein
LLRQRSGYLTFVALREKYYLATLTSLAGVTEINQDINERFWNSSLLKSLLCVTGKGHFVLHRFVAMEAIKSTRAACVKAFIPLLNSDLY